MRRAEQIDLARPRVVAASIACPHRRHPVFDVDENTCEDRSGARFLRPYRGWLRCGFALVVLDTFSPPSPVLVRRASSRSAR